MEGTKNQFDLIVIGGGINGVAIARDAALRGYAVALVEREDFAASTTSWSTRLIHGGLRYLEHREFGLVRESLVERDRLLRNAGHLVRPLQFQLPVYEGARFGGPAIRAALSFYDLVSLRSPLPRHRYRTPDDADTRLLNPHGLEGVASYYDAQVEYPERLTIELALAARSSNARFHTHTAVTGLLSSGQTVTGVAIRDVLTGAESELHGRAVINVAGPWVDAVFGNDEQPLIGGTRGTHLIFPAPALPLKSAIYAEASSDGRPFFIVPWCGMVMVGTTDAREDGDPGRVHPESWEVDYLLDEARRLAPGLDLEREAILFGYTGVRPLPAAEGPAGAVSRDHKIVSHAPERTGLFSVIGGKLTTHRSLAEDAVDLIAEQIGAKRPCHTAKLLYPGAMRMRNVPAVDLDLEPAGFDRLSRIYGGLVGPIFELAAQEPELNIALDEARTVLAAEVAHAVRYEMANTLTDIIARRMMLSWRPGLAQELAHPVAQVAAQQLGWSELRKAGEIDDYFAWLRRFNWRS